MYEKQLLKQYQKYPEIEKQFGFSAFKQLRNIASILNGSKNVLPRFINCETNLLELLIFCPDGLIYTCPESIGIRQHAIKKIVSSISIKIYFTNKY